MEITSQPASPEHQPGEQARKHQKKRRFKYGTNALILTISVVGLLVLAYLALIRVHWRVDFTANSSLTLASQTREVLEGLEQPVTIRAFFRPAGDLDQVFIRRKVDDVLREYAALSDAVDYALLDPDVDIEQTLAFGVRTDGTIVFQSGPRRKDIYQSVLFNYPSLSNSTVPLFVGESHFTNAILSITQGEQAKLCYVTGHGERNPDSVETEGTRNILKLLESENYLLETVTLGRETSWEQRCEALIIAGPKLGFHPGEDAAILKSIKAGKKMVLMVDPQTRLGLDRTLQEFGLKMANAVVFDPDKHFILGSHYPAPLVKNHEITKTLQRQNFAPVLYLARPIAIAATDLASPYHIETLLSTSPIAWGETRLKAQEKAKYDHGTDISGPITLGVSISKREAAEPLALVFGDSNFITNGLVDVPGNKDLFLNGVAWLLGQEELISIRPVKPDFRPLMMEPDQARLVSLSTQLIYPGVILGFGLMYWWRRRRA